jgi:hypothetical protein
LNWIQAAQLSVLPPSSAVDHPTAAVDIPGADFNTVHETSTNASRLDDVKEETGPVGDLPPAIQVDSDAHGFEPQETVVVAAGVPNRESLPPPSAVDRTFSLVQDRKRGPAEPGTVSQDRKGTTVGTMPNVKRPRLAHRSYTTSVVAVVAKRSKRWRSVDPCSDAMPLTSSPDVSDTASDLPLRKPRKASVSRRHNRPMERGRSQFKR